MNTHTQHHRSILQGIAHRAMLERGLLPDFSTEALAELEQIQNSIAKAPTLVPDVPTGNVPVGIDSNTVRDRRNLLWASIDNDDSRDLDQLTVAEALPAGKVKILVAIADVDSSVKNGSAIDEHARHNTTSVYTAAEIFPMIPEKLSTDVTSLNFNQDRLAVVVEMMVGADGSLEDSKIYKAWVRNHAKLAYNSIAAWLERKGDVPEEIAAVQGLAENLQLQDRVAQSMKKLRHLHGRLAWKPSRPSRSSMAIKFARSK
jgi:exoribonuclease R